MALHCTEPFVIICPSSRYDLNNVERDIKHQIIIINIVDKQYKVVQEESVLLLIKRYQEGEWIHLQGKRFSQNYICLSSEKGSSLNRKNLLPWSRPRFRRDLICRKANKNSQKLSPFLKKGRKFTKCIQSLYYLDSS